MNRSYRAVTTAAVFFCVALAVVSGASGEQAGPTFYVEQNHLDLGTVVAGEIVTGIFVFHNEGSEDVRIIRAAPS